MSEKEIIKTTCPRDCYDSCGMVAIKRDGKVTKVLGDREHPVSRGALCGKCALAYNGVFRDPGERLLHPLRRTGRKGEGHFERVGWDEALTAIAERLGAIRADDPSRILTAHYTGTCSVIANAFPMRFFNHIGAAEVVPDSICNNAGHVALDYVLGISAKGFDPRTARDSACLVVWGCNPHSSAPHAYRNWLKEQPGKLIVIDPVRTPTAELADVYLQPRPGSDAALAFGMMHVIVKEGLIDRRFVAAHTHGFEELEPLIADFDLTRAAAATSLEPAAIERAARLYAAGPSLLWLGQALQRQPTGGNVFRAAAMLPALTGNIGKPGAGIYFLNGKGPTRGLDMDAVPRPDLCPSPPVAVSHMDLVETVADPARTGALVLWNINPMASNPDPRALARALSREDLLVVVIDLFRTDSARYGDFVLPAASFLEFDDLVGSYMHLSLSAQAKVMEPLGESLPNQEIFRRLARAMGLTEPALYESDRAIIDDLLARSPFDLDFDALKAAGTVAISPEPVILFEDLRFPTPSGRIEIASDRAEAAGLPRTPQPWADDPPADGRLRLLSPASLWHLNSSYDNDPRIAKQSGPATITLNPSDAARRGLVAGQDVRVFNDVGALTLKLAVADIVRPGTALSPKGRWPGRDPAGANVNCLNPGIKSDMGESTTVHGVEVAVAAAG